MVSLLFSSRPGAKLSIYYCLMVTWSRSDERGPIFFKPIEGTSSRSVERRRIESRRGPRLFQPRPSYPSTVLRISELRTSVPTGINTIILPRSRNFLLTHRVYVQLRGLLRSKTFSPFESQLLLQSKRILLTSLEQTAPIVFCLSALHFPALLMYNFKTTVSEFQRLKYDCDERLNVLSVLSILAVRVEIDVLSYSISLRLVRRRVQDECIRNAVRRTVHLSLTVHQRTVDVLRWCAQVVCSRLSSPSFCCCVFSRGTLRHGRRRAAHYWLRSSTEQCPRNALLSWNVLVHSLGLMPNQNGVRYASRDMANTDTNSQRWGNVYEKLFSTVG